MFVKYQSSYPGLGFVSGYKILQRLYEFDGQPYGETLETEKTRGKLVISSLAGSAVIVLLP